MKKDTIRIVVMLLSVLMTGMLTACDKLEDGNAISELLPGTWTFSYETSEDIDFAIEYDHVVFEENGTCAIVYGNERLEGSYRASDAAIRIDYHYEREERNMVWKVLQMSPYRIVTEYSFDHNHRTITAIVTLEKVKE